MQDLESKIDAGFDSNPLLKLPFCVLYNLLCQIATRHLLDEKQLPFSYFSPFYFIFEKNSNFTKLSLKQCQELTIKINLNDFKNLMQCATLNIVFPFIHSGVYSLEQISHNESYINYASKEVADLEIRDVVITNLSLPRIAPFKVEKREFLQSTLKRIKRGEPIKVTKCKKYISTLYSSISKAFIEEPLVPEIFYTYIGFSESSAFKQIRHAFCALGQAYIDAAFLVDSYLKENALYNSSTENLLWTGLAMECLRGDELRQLILEICRCKLSDYKKFEEFFFSSPGENKNLSKKFMPPFWQIDEMVYFMPGAVPTLLGSRNLLIAIQNDHQKNKKYKYDQMISDLFEPALLKRAENYFQVRGFSTAIEKDFDGGEIDLLVYCKKSHTILTVQAKATLFPETARMVRRLDDRIDEAIVQTQKFDNLKDEQKVFLYKSCFDSDQDFKQVNHLRAVLTNSSFGSYKSWQQLESKEIVPLNCNIIRNVLSECAILSQLPEATKIFIQKVVDISGPEIKDKIFQLDGHTIYQKHIEENGTNKLLEIGLAGG